MNTININELSEEDAEYLLTYDYERDELPEYDFNCEVKESDLNVQIEQLIAYIEELEGVRL